MPRMAAQGTHRPASDPDSGSAGAAEAEALAAVAMIAAGSRAADDGPSKAVTGTLVVLGVMLAAVILLALLLSV